MPSIAATRPTENSATACTLTMPVSSLEGGGGRRPQRKSSFVVAHVAK